MQNIIILERVQNPGIENSVDNVLLFVPNSMVRSASTYEEEYIMNKLKLLILLLCLGIIIAYPAHSAQIGGKALGDVDDVVKEATHGSLEIPKHSIMLLKAGEVNGNNSYLQTNIMTLNHESNIGMKSLQVLSNQGKIVDPFKKTTVMENNSFGILHPKTKYEGGIQTVPVMNLTPVVSRRSYNGKKVVMWNTTNENSFKAHFAALQNNNSGGGYGLR